MLQLPHKITVLAAVATAVVATTALTASASEIGVQFVGSGTALNAAASAGVVPQTNWNTLTGSSFSNVSLHDNTSTAIGASISGTPSGTFSGGNNITTTAGDRTLSSGEIYNSIASSPANPLTFSNIPYASYDVYAYAAVDQSQYQNRPTVAETIQVTPTGGGTSYWSFLPENSAAWNLAASTWNGSGSQPPSIATANYAEFANLTANGFTLLFNSTGGNTAINGIEIVATPEPTTLSLLAVAGAGLLLIARRGRA